MQSPVLTAHFTCGLIIGQSALVICQLWNEYGHTWHRMSSMKSGAIIQHNLKLRPSNLMISATSKPKQNQTELFSDILPCDLPCESLLCTSTHLFNTPPSFTTYVEYRSGHDTIIFQVVLDFYYHLCKCLCLWVIYCVVLRYSSAFYSSVVTLKALMHLFSLIQLTFISLWITFLFFSHWTALIHFTYALFNS